MVALISFNLKTETLQQVKETRALIEKARAKLDEMSEQLDSAETKHNGLTNTQKLAIMLHNKLCKWNHTDGCGWYYHVKDGLPTWEDYSQQEYLRKATLLCRKAEKLKITPEAAMDLMDSLS